MPLLFTMTARLKVLRRTTGHPSMSCGATRRAFENLIQLAIGDNIDFLVIAGDLYDGVWKDYGAGAPNGWAVPKIRARMPSGLPA
jgi:hypothetical protein